MRFAVASIAVIALVGSTSHGFERLPGQAPAPKNNPTTPAKVALGKELFFDPRLSKTGTVSCNSCHNVMNGGDDNSAFSTGVNGLKGGRSAPTVWNAAFLSVQFWDGRAKSLEDQASGPLLNPVEMGMANADEVVSRINKIPGYQNEFANAFPNDGTNISIDHLTKAIAAYERTLITPDSAVDRFLAGDKKALNQSAQRGMQLVKSVGCVSCHSGANYAGPQLPEGQGFFMKFPTYPGSEYEKEYELSKDLGRYTVTKNEADKNMWRVPTWRNVALTAPYFHNGSVKTLPEAVRVMAKTQLNKSLSDDETNDIVEFLKGLTGKRPQQTFPALPPAPGESVFLTFEYQGAGIDANHILPLRYAVRSLIRVMLKTQCLPP